MTQEQQGIWVVQWAIYRGGRYARKQQLRRRLTQRIMLADCIDFADYCARREAREI